jgi:hypothetical protein
MLKISKMENKVRSNNSFNLLKKILFKERSVKFVLATSIEGNKPKKTK